MEIKTTIQIEHEPSDKQWVSLENIIKELQGITDPCVLELLEKIKK